MAKINISFNGTNYSIDEASIQTAIAALQSHLSTTMNGTGATINLDGASYSVDSTKLATATNAFVTHLGTVSGSGYKVKVGNVEYGVGSDKVAGAVGEIEAVLAGLNNPDAPSGDEILEGDGQEFHKFAPCALTFRSTAPLNELQEVQINGITVDPSNYTLEEGSTVVTLPIEYLNTLDVDNYEITVVSDSKSAKGGFSVVQPELNEHGFYYNQPYAADVYALGGSIAVIFQENGWVNIISSADNTTTICTYTTDGNIMVVDSPMGVLHCSTISTDTAHGIYCEELGTTFIFGIAGIISDDEYIYMPHTDEGVDGYMLLSVIDKNKNSYAPMKTCINGKPTIYIECDAFANTTALKEIVIPASIFNIADGAFEGCTNLERIVFEEDSQLHGIGDGAFSNCTSLKSVELPNGLKMLGAFSECTSLEYLYIPDSVTGLRSPNMFENCSKLTYITYAGTIAQWNAISKYSFWERDSALTYVQCSDGQVTLTLTT